MVGGKSDARRITSACLSACRCNSVREMAKSFAFIAAGVLMAIGLAAAIVPDAIIASGRRMVSPSGLYAAAAFRSGIALVLLMAAKAMLGAVAGRMDSGAVPSPPNQGRCAGNVFEKSD
jgi:hypothetical protein